MVALIQSLYFRHSFWNTFVSLPLCRSSISFCSSSYSRCTSLSTEPCQAENSPSSLQKNPCQARATTEDRPNGDRPRSGTLQQESNSTDEDYLLPLINNSTYLLLTLGITFWNSQGFSNFISSYGNFTDFAITGMTETWLQNDAPTRSIRNNYEAIPSKATKDE